MTKSRFDWPAFEDHKDDPMDYPMMIGKKLGDCDADDLRRECEIRGELARAAAAKVRALEVLAKPGINGAAKFKAMAAFVEADRVGRAGSRRGKPSSV